MICNKIIIKFIVNKSKYQSNQVVSSCLRCKNLVKRMNKSIFKKIKKSHLESINQSPKSQQQIQFMSVQDMQKTLLTHINSSNDESPSKQIIDSNSQSPQSLNKKMSQRIYFQNNEVYGSLEQKKLPELAQQNDQLKDEIEKLKNQRKLILSQYENLSNSSKINSYQYNSIQSQLKQRQFSFSKSVQNVEKFISSKPSEKNYEKPIRQNSFRQRQLGSIHERNVPSSDSNKQQRQSADPRLGTSLSSKARGSNLLSSGSKEVFTTLEERFYHYCKNEMVRLNTENTKLNLKIGELQSKITTMHKQYQLLQLQNTHFKSLNQSLQQKLKNQNQKIDKIAEEMSTTLIKKQQITQNQFKIFKNQLTQLKTISQNLKKQLYEKNIEIISLKAEISKKEIQSKSNTQLFSKNVFLQNQINELMLKNKKLSDKFRRMPVIDHLWQIKEVEYQNLMNLVQQQKAQLPNFSTFRNIQNKKPHGNALDMTFSKDNRIV